MLRVQILTILLTFLFFCAQRDNRFDPLSPLYRTAPPELTVAFNCDTNRIAFKDGNQFEIIPPFLVKFSVDAKRKDLDKSLPVSVQYYSNSEFIEQKDNINNYQKEIVKCGIHEFRFKSFIQDGGGTEETYIFKCIQQDRPEIKSFTCNHDTLPVNRNVTASFVTLISDSLGYLDSIVYVMPDGKTLKQTEFPDILFYDSIETTMFNNSEAEKEIKVILYDELGKGDSASIVIAFEEGFQYNVGIPPDIDSIWANEEEILVEDRIDFEISAHDSDGAIVKYFWTFGDNVFRYSDSSRVSHTYYSPGSYVVIVSVIDDSGNTSMDSIVVEAKMVEQKSLRILSLNAKPDSGICPLKVTFEAEVNDTTSEIEYKWLFGDFGSYWSKSDSKITHIYNYPGTFYVMLAVKNDKEQDTMTTIVNVTGTELKIKANKDTVYEGDTVRLSILEPDYEEFILYKWSLPDTSIHTHEPEIEHVFNMAGYYHISVMTYGDQFKTGDIFIKVQSDDNKKLKEYN